MAARSLWVGFASVIAMTWLLGGPAERPSAATGYQWGRGPNTSWLPTSTRLREVWRRRGPDVEAAVVKALLRPGAPAFVRIFKEDTGTEYGMLELWLRDGPGAFRLFKSYPVCYYSGGLGPKLRTGDNQAPEGFYGVQLSAELKRSGMNPVSNYHLSINTWYPNTFDRVLRRTGSALMIHGDCVSIGCYAMGDGNIEEIYLLVDAALRDSGQPVQIHIFPFRMTEKNLNRHRESPWFEFWRNLKEGYDLFERSHVPPRVSNAKGRYVFSAGHT